MKKEEKLSAELREKVAEVRLDNEGKPENQKVTRKEVAAEVKKINPYCTRLARGYLPTATRPGTSRPAATALPSPQCKDGCQTPQAARKHSRRLFRIAADSSPRNTRRPSGK